MQGQPSLDSIENWLETRAYGYDQLQPNDRQAVLQFTLIWSLFEENLFGPESASVRLFAAKVESWNASELAKRDDFQSALVHFQTRYFQAGAFTPAFSHLKFRPRDDEAGVRAVISGVEQNPKKLVIALLTIIYRLRNNLFHGPKWAYGIAGQTANFSYANIALTALLAQEGGFY